jgi:hypothetical protein
MSEQRYLVSERVLVSRDESGEGHEEATVVDYYVLLMEGSSIPSIVVDFDDGERKYLAAREPNALSAEEVDDDEVGVGADEGESELPAEPYASTGGARSRRRTSSLHRLV